VTINWLLFVLIVGSDSKGASRSEGQGCRYFFHRQRAVCAHRDVAASKQERAAHHLAV
jgi:hypothetical protein